MILHLASDEKFIDYVIDIFEKANPNNNTYLIPNDQAEIKFLKSKHKNVIVTPLNSKTFKQITSNLDTYEAIIIHNLYDEYKQKILLKNTLKNHIHIHWMSWGTDLYFIPQLSSHLLSPITKQKVSKSKLPIQFFIFQHYLQNRYSFLADKYALFKGNSKGYYKFKEALKNISSYTTVIPEEIHLVNKYFNIDNVPYIPFRYATIENSLDKFQKDYCINNHFLIGNSATITNNHFDAFQIIKDSNIKNHKIYVPLSYGDEAYARKVAKVGVLFFNIKFNPIFEFLKKEEFNQLLNECGNVVMNHHRQQALGTILISLWKGARLFLNPLNPLNHFFKTNGFLTFSMSDLKKEPELPSFNYLAKRNRPYITKLYSEKNVLMETHNLVAYICKKETTPKDDQTT